MSVQTGGAPGAAAPLSPRRVGIIPGSTRPGANSAAFAQWIHQLCSAGEGLTYEIISLSDWALPLFDEPGVPAVTGPSLGHSKAWSEKVSSLHAFIFVSPQVRVINQAFSSRA